MKERLSNFREKTRRERKRVKEYQDDGGNNKKEVEVKVMMFETGKVRRFERKTDRERRASFGVAASGMDSSPRCFPEVFWSLEELHGLTSACGTRLACQSIFFFLGIFFGTSI